STSGGSNSSTGGSTATGSLTNVSSSGTAVRENFVLTNADCELYHFSVTGNFVKQISSTSDMNNGSITSIAWKSDLLVLGDSDGNINVWFLKEKESKTIPTERGWVKRIRFSPGRGNHKCLILYADGVDIFDMKEMKLCSTLK